MTYYEVLQVSPDASKAVIDAAWKALMKVYHPDNGTSPNQEMARELNQAHDVLSDPKKRRTYDRKLMAARPQPIPVNTTEVRAYPPAYPSPFGFPPINLNLAEILEHAVRSGSQAVLDKLIEDNPALVSLLNISTQKRRRRR